MQNSIREPELQEKIIRSHYLYGTNQEKHTLDTILGRKDVHPGVKDMIQRIRTQVEYSSRREVTGSSHPIPVFNLREAD